MHKLQIMKGLNTIALLLMACTTFSQVEFLVEIDPETGTWEKIDSITGVDWIITSNASFDPINKQYTFVGSDPSINWRLISLDIDDVPDPTDIDIASDPFYPGADPGDNMQSMEADQLTGVSYALHWDASGNTEYIVSVDRETGDYELICAIPDVEFVYNDATFDSASKIYTFKGKTVDDPWALYSVNLTTGLVISSPEFPIVDDIWDRIDYLQYNADGELFGLFWDSSEEIQYFVSIDPATGEHEIISAIPDIDWVMGGTVFDEMNNRYSFLGSDGPFPLQLVTIDAATGEVLYRPDLILDDISDNVIELQYDNSTGTLYGLHWDAELLCPESYGEISVSTCDSFLSPSGIYEWTETGVFTDTLASITGCDSIITIDLTITFADTTVTIGPYDLTSNESDAIYQWIDCNRDMLPIGGAIDQVFIPAEVGSYAVIVNDGGCIDTSDCIAFCFDSYEEISVSVCNNYISPSGIYEWTESGIFMDTLVNMAGCDSIITIDLTVAALDITVTSDLYNLTSNETGATYQWLDCNDDMLEIDGATDQVFTPLENGSYAVVVTDGECTDTSACFDITALSTEHEGRIIAAKIYPNPSNGNFNIEFSANHGNKIAVEIKDITGRALYTAEYDGSKNISINPKIAIGTYYVQIRFENNKIFHQEILIIN